MNLKNLFKLPIYTETSPNMQWDDIFLVTRILLQPWSWKKKKFTNKFSNELKDYFGVKSVHLNDSGRTSLNLSLKALNIGEGNEIIMPSFTCLVVANAVFWTGAKAIYIDTAEEDFNFDLSQIESKLSNKTKAILVQHTFGKKVDVNKIKEILERNKDKFEDNKLPYIIEDWAHLLYRNQPIEGDLAFLTFGIEKMFSTIRGGAVITNDQIISDKIEIETEKLQEFPTKRTIIALLNPIFWWVDVPLHKIGYKRYTLGAAVRMIWRKLGFLGIMIEKAENRSIKPEWYPAQLSPALARLGSNQLKKLDKYNEHRNKIAAIYEAKLGFLSDSRDQKFLVPTTYIRYPILLRSEEEKSNIWEAAKAIKITLGAWYKTPLYATYVTDEAYKKLGFHFEMVPNTVKKCKTVLNLPTSINISQKRASELAEVLGKILE
jgi:perosamine synthetase